MRPEIPYRVIGRLGTCDIGTVWLAVDDFEHQVTVAVLNEAVAADQQWRDAFAASTTVSTEPEQRTGFLQADFTTTEPWVAYPGEQDPGAERVFIALGRDYRSDAPKEVSYDDEPPEITSPAPYQVEPATPFDAGPDPFSSPGRRIVPSTPKKRRPRGLLVGIAVGVVLLLAAGGVVFAVVNGGGGDPDPTPSTGGTVAASQPTTEPVHPGLEPPRPGDWPNKWPVFGPTNPVRPVNLDGLGFTLTLPARWECVAAAVSPGNARYNCGRNTDNGQIGGELTVRACTPVCDEAHRDELRKVEEAWGAQWRYAGANATLAETLTLDGADRYGLVVIGYWASTPGSAIDRQLVLRMTAPPNWVDDIRRVANGVRDSTKF
ncbi:hypothetical protein DFJ67_6348 [Asanoa ferruginea]|uniref:Uncharacterized protein n=1 Tax=Asanoa ferruginea TaxID=53367 RepID=A0A3D9ZSC2_9ACTN|nr:hypothetical protein [Asanoa ferruginea]REG00297.1 hypothetical protein DFJ67_6348 [Asanoa ferruginea]GIF52140.1 hypothetical protein Afe04nite_66790 [Asanoa ferruginea]